jgi:hypothetical protein
MSTAVTPTAVIGEIEAGQAAKVRKQLKDLIKSVNTSTFDIMDLLHEVSVNKYYQPKYETFKDFCKSLDMKSSKSYYLVRIKEKMLLAGIDRATYEPVGITKLRVIAQLQPTDEDGKVSQIVLDQIKILVMKAPSKTAEELQTEVDTYQGNVGDEAWDFMSFRLKKSQKEVVKQALELVKAQIGSVGKDADGNSTDASDGSALEKMALDYLSDPNNEKDIEQMGGTDAAEVEDAEQSEPAEI